jgi:hypothetical protein
LEDESKGPSQIIVLSLFNTGLYHRTSYLRLLSSSFFKLFLFFHQTSAFTMGHWSFDGKYTTDLDSDVESDKEVE